MANAGYDPRKRRLNPHIDEYIGILDEHWHSLVGEDDFLERKGRLRVIRGLIDRILAEPEWLEADLQEGAAPTTDCWLEPDQFTDPAAPMFSVERPFDTPGSANGKHFFYTDTGKISYLYEGEPIDPGRLYQPLRSYGPFVYTFERSYVTSPETRMRVISANLWEQLVPEASASKSADLAEPYALLCDPKGIGGGHQAVRVADLGDREEAIRTAVELSDRLQIRFLIARERIKFCTR